MKALYPTFPTEPPVLNALQTLLTSTSHRHLVTRLYNTAQMDRPTSATVTMVQWNISLHTPVSLEEWSFCCTLTGMATLNCNLRIIHFKFLQQTYYTPLKLFRYELQNDSCCVRCGTSKAGFLHLALDCRRVHEYYETVVNALSEITSDQLQCTPQMCLLLRLVKPISTTHRKFVAVALLLAKRRVAMSWGKCKVPNICDCIKYMTYCKTTLETYVEELPASLQPHEIWSPLMSFLMNNPDMELSDM